MNRNTLTASRSPSRRRPLLFLGSRAPARATAPAGAARAAPPARHRSGRPARPARSVLAAPRAATTPSTPPGHALARRACDRSDSRAPPLHAETLADTAFGTSASLAWPDSLSAGPDSPALSCPRNRGHSNDCSRLAYAEVLSDERATTAIGFLRRARAWIAVQGVRV